MGLLRRTRKKGVCRKVYRVIILDAKHNSYYLSVFKRYFRGKGEGDNCVAF